MKPCLDCKKPARGSRCTTCTRAKDKARGTRQQRGYDAQYDAAHRDWERRIASGEYVLCWRCLTERNVETVITMGTPWDLGHDDLDRTIIRGPECRGPNRGTAGRQTPHPTPLDAGQQDRG